MGPFIDPSVLLLDPMFTDQFSVVQQIQGINNFGEVTKTPVQTDGIIGVVTPSKPGELRRVPDNERGMRTITIYTQARLNTASQGSPAGAQRQPDLVLWHGDTFIVKDIMPWTSYGPGWVRAIATSQDAIEAVT